MSINQKGFLTVWVLVFGAVFIIMLVGITGFLASQIKHHQSIKSKNLALQIAEAGINYARWHLAHDDGDFSFGGVYDYKDPESGNIGKYNLEITAPGGCMAAVQVKSTGWKNNDESNQRIIKMNYAKPALAKYGFLTNSNAWFGEFEELKGPFHSNGGVRMDGSQNSLSTSAKSIYICGTEHGCSQTACNSPCIWKSAPKQCECPGIWGAGQGGVDGLWQFPSPNIDFNALTQDLSNLKTLAQTSERYFAPSSSGLGYHIVFLADGSFNIFQVTSLYPAVWGYNGTSWVSESNDIQTEAILGNVVLPVNCAPIFIEDNLWVEGAVLGRATVIAARLPDLASTNAKIIIPNNITYVNSDSALGLIAQKDVLISLRSPDNLQIRATMLAQKGHVFRYYYAYSSNEPFKTYAIRNRIETYGSIISNTMWTFTWADGGNNVISGYKITSMNYDSDLTFNPPPHFPTSGDYEVIRWQELRVP